MKGGGRHAEVDQATTRACVVLIGTALTAVPVRGAVDVAPDVKGVTIYVQAGDPRSSRMSVREGQVVDVGAIPDADGSCVLPGGGLGVRIDVSDPDVGSVSVTTSFDEACRLIIESIEIEGVSAPGASKPPGDGWVTPEITSDTAWTDPATWP